MDHLRSQSSEWYHAVTLSERIALLRSIQHNTLKTKASVAPAKERMERWRSQSPFSTDSYFTQRLQMDSITEDELLYLLSEPVENVQQCFTRPPSWLADLSQALSQPVHPDPIRVSETMRGKEIFGFLGAIEPIISQARERVNKGIRELAHNQSDLPFDQDSIEELLLANLPGILLMMLSRALVLELNVCRMEGLLDGSTPEERFKSFLERICRRDAALSILQEHPVLARQLVARVSNWVNFSLEFLRHLCMDWDVIWETFSPEREPGVLMQLDGGAGDTHRGGRSVMIARFSSGFRVVYKPKSLAADMHFQELLAWLNERGNHPPFRILKVLDRGAYGWVEFAAAHGCSSPEEVQRFYERQGGYLALLYALEATDFHFENLIAAGEHPVLIDLESLFHPHIGDLDTTRADMLAGRAMERSVLRPGLLPQRIWSSADYDGIDLSGLGAVEGQLAPDRAPYLEGIGTDEMRFARKRMEMQGGHNRPILGGAEVNALDYTESMVTGFTSVYQLLTKYRGELLSDDGPLARFADDEMRVILRPTRIYWLLLYESFHPDMLRDALDREQFFDKLWVGVKSLPYLARAIPAERKDLQNGDIPMFITQPSSTDIWSSSGGRITDFADETGMSMVQRRIQQLSDQDMARQLWFIRASLATLTMDTDRAKWSKYRMSEPETIADRERLLKGSCAIANRLDMLALRGEGDASWLGLSLINERHWVLAPLGMDMYSGIPGLALYLAYLGSVTEEERYIALSRAALTTLRRQIQSARSYITPIGHFAGWGGVIYTLTHLGALWNEPELFDEAKEIVEFIPGLIEQDETLDIIAGAAGCIGSLISLYHCSTSDNILTAAIQCGDRLIARARQMERGIGWITQLAEKMPLAGFSHGAAGMAWALLELFAATGEERFREAAIAAIEYERSLFSPEAANWLDQRMLEDGKKQRDSKPTYMTAWCHGAPGIGLARLASIQHLDDPEIRAEIDVALRATLNKGFGHNHSLCHGDLGNLELLLQASEILEDPQWRFQVDRIATMILESIEENGWLCGVPLGVETPGMMTGLAGIGYELLRLAEPTRIPSILILEPPAVRKNCGMPTPNFEHI